MLPPRVVEASSTLQLAHWVSYQLCVFLSAMCNRRWMLRYAYDRAEFAVAVWYMAPNFGDCSHRSNQRIHSVHRSSTACPCHKLWLISQPWAHTAGDFLAMISQASAAPQLMHMLWPTSGARAPL